MIIRKIRTLLAILCSCRNWPSIVAAKIGIKAYPHDLFLRNGLRFSVEDLAMRWGEIFEPAVADVYELQKVPTCALIVDVGANLGGFACAAAWRFPEARVIAFEPNEAVRAFFSNHLAINNLTNVMLISEIVTRDGRTVEWYARNKSTTGGIVDHDSSVGVARSSVNIASLHLERYPSVFIKLDCEGAEGELIQWFAEHGSELPPVIRLACEWHPWCPLTLDSARSLLDSVGFKTESKRKFDEDYLFACRSTRD